MSFQKPVWRYRPPETVWSGRPPARPEELEAQPGPQTARRSELARRMRQLSQTAGWLAGALLERHADVSVRIGGGDPELAAALARLFDADTAPQAITAAMYGHLLDALLGAIRTQAVLDEQGLPYQVSPLQQMDLIRAVAAVEDALAASDQEGPQRLLALPYLKADAWMFSEMAEQIEPVRLEEPGPDDAAADSADAFLPEETPIGQLVDLSQLQVSFEREPEPLEDGYRGFDTDTSQIEEPEPEPAEPEEEPPFRMDPEPDGDIDEAEYQAWLDRLEEAAAQYQSHWQAISGQNSLLDESPLDVLEEAASAMDAVSSGVRRLIREYLTWPANRLIAILATLETAWRLLHKDRLAVAKGALGIFVLARLVTETSRMNFFLSRLLYRLSAPIERLVNSAAHLTNLPYEALIELDSVLSTARRTRVAGGMASRIPEEEMARLKRQLSAMPRALSAFSRAVSGARAALIGRVSRAQAALFQLIDRRLIQGASQADALDALRTIQELKSIFETLVRRRRNQTVELPSAPPQPPVPVPPAAVAMVLNAGPSGPGSQDASHAVDSYDQRTNQTTAV